MAFNKSLILGDRVEVGVKVNTLKTESKKISGHFYCETCGEQLHIKRWCNNCNAEKKGIRKLINKEGKEVNLEEYKQQLGNPNEFISLKPISRDKLGFKAVDKIYILTPQKNSETRFNYLYNYLVLFNKILPIQKYRSNKNSFEREGYIEVVNGYMVLNLMVEQEITNDIEPFKPTELNKEALYKFSKLLNMKEEGNKESYIQVLGLLKENTNAKKLNGDDEFLKLVESV